MIAGVVYAVVGFMEVLVGLRFLFQLVGANPASGFVNWVYDLSTPLVAPFAGIFGQDSTITGQGVVAQSVFDWAALVALVVIGLVGAVIARALSGTRA